MAGISIHGPTAVNGTYNVLGIENGSFFLQGNLTIEQMRELVNEANKVLRAEQAQQRKRRRVSKMGS